MTWGQLAATVRDARAERDQRLDLGGFQTRDLSQITVDMIAWQQSGYSTDGLALPPVFAVVRLIASTIDQLDLTVDGGIPPLWLRSPRRFGGALDIGDLIQWTVSAMALNGAAYLLATRTGESWRLDALHPGSVQPQVSTTGVVSLKYHVNGVEVPEVPPFSGQWRDGASYVVHIPYLTTPQHPAGCSPITVCRESMLGYFTVEREAATLIDRGTYSGGRLETDQDITTSTAERYQTKWVANRREGLIPVLGAGLRYVNDLVNPHDAQWLESRQFNSQQVASMFGVPVDYLGLTMMGGASSLSYNNSQDNDRRFRRNCLEAFTSQVEDALSMLTPPGRTPDESQEVRFNYDGWEVTGGTQDAAVPSPSAGGPVQ